MLTISTLKHHELAPSDQVHAGKNRFECRTCPYQMILDRRYYERKNMETKGAEDVLGGADSWKNVDKTEGKLDLCCERIIREMTRLTCEQRNVRVKAANVAWRILDRCKFAVLTSRRRVSTSVLSALQSGARTDELADHRQSYDTFWRTKARTSGSKVYTTLFCVWRTAPSLKRIARSPYRDHKGEPRGRGKRTVAMLESRCIRHFRSSTRSFLLRKACDKATWNATTDLSVLGRMRICLYRAYRFHHATDPTGDSVSSEAAERQATCTVHHEPNRSFTPSNRSAWLSGRKKCSKRYLGMERV
jgi:hypothetical protein